MRPHTRTHAHTRRAAHAPASHLEPRSRSPSCAKRVYVTSPKRHTRHGSCARTARSSQRTQDRMWFDLSSQTATQTRASNEARNDGPLRQRARELRHRVLGDVHAVVLPAPVCSICSCRGETSSDDFRDGVRGGVHGSSLCQFRRVHQASSGGLCSRSAHRTKRVWSRTNTWRHVALPAAGRLRVSSSSVSARRLFLGPRHPKPALHSLATPHATPSHAAPRATSTGRALEHRA